MLYFPFGSFSSAIPPSKCARRNNRAKERAMEWIKIKAVVLFSCLFIASCGTDESCDNGATESCVDSCPTTWDSWLQAFDCTYHCYDDNGCNPVDCKTDDFGELCGQGFDLPCIHDECCSGSADVTAFANCMDENCP